MNTYAHKTNAAVYANTAAGKRNSCTVRPKRFCKNIKPYLYSSGTKNVPDGNNPRGTVDSILKLFSGAIVSEYATAVEWGDVDYFTTTGH
jgi:hypothetical protein